MMLNQEPRTASRLEDETFEAEQLIKKINALVFEDESGTRLVTAQRLMTQCRERVSEIAEEIKFLSANPSERNVLEIAGLLKLQSRLTVAMGAAVRHVSRHLRNNVAKLQRSKLYR